MEQNSKVKVLDELSVEMRNAMLKVLLKKSNAKKIVKEQVTNFDIMGVLASSIIDVLTVTSDSSELSKDDWMIIVAEAFRNAIDKTNVSNEQ